MAGLAVGSRGTFAIALVVWAGCERSAPANVEAGEVLGTAFEPGAAALAEGSDGRDVDSPSDERPVLQLQFDAVRGGRTLRCDDDVAAGAWVLRDLLLYVHEAAWWGADGVRRPLVLVDEEVWQRDGVALLDFAGGDNGCVMSQTAAMNTDLTFEWPPSDVAPTHLEFRIGVPFGLNHRDPTLNRGPLAAMFMHWGWRGGYKFVRLEGTGETRFSLHLGSTGCTGPMSAVEGCTEPGQRLVRLPWTGPAQTVVLDVGALVNARLASGESCMGNPDGEGGPCSDAWRALAPEGDRAAADGSGDGSGGGSQRALAPQTGAWSTRP